MYIGTKFDYHNGENDLCISRKTRTKSAVHQQQEKLVQQMEDLKYSLEGCEERSKVMTLVPYDVMTYLRSCMTYSPDASSPVSYFFCMSTVQHVLFLLF